MNLEESLHMVDRALITLCTDIPESLGLLNTSKDQLSISAIREIPMCNKIEVNSRKFHLIRDWMRSYEPNQDVAITKEIHLEELERQYKKEQKELARKLHAELNANRGEFNQRKKDQVKEKLEKYKALTHKKNEKIKKTTKNTKIQRKSIQEISNSESSDSSSDSTSASESSESKSSENEKEVVNGKRKRSTSSNKQKKNNYGELPPLATVLSSDEEEEPNEMFDAADPDMYEVDKILDKRDGRYYGDEDEYLVKWVGYDEPTWEPASNIMKSVIDEYEGEEVREGEYKVEKLVNRRTVRSKRTKIKSYEYLVQWVGYPPEENTWEPGENLPHNLRRKFDQEYERMKKRKTS